MFSRFKGKVRGKAKGQAVGPNKTEIAYGALLEERRVKGEILAYSYEPVKVRLADNTFYTPDYLVVAADYCLEFHEVKAAWKDKKTGGYKPHWESAGRVKIKVAVEQYPFFKFIAAAKTPTGWMYEEF